MELFPKLAGQVKEAAKLAAYTDGKGKGKRGRGRGSGRGRGAKEIKNNEANVEEDQGPAAMQQDKAEPEAPKKHENQKVNELQELWTIKAT